MRILIEQLKPGTKKDAAREYWTFWVRVFSGDLWVSVSGFRYFPDKRTIALPAAQKGNGSYHDMTKMSGVLFNRILEEVERLLGVEDEVVAA
jgi:hypothetical protein